jgi:hypothetical protein
MCSASATWIKMIGEVIEHNQHNQRFLIRSLHYRGVLITSVNTVAFYVNEIN